MARPRRGPRPALIDELAHRPAAFPLFQALRVLERAEAVEAARLGVAAAPAIGRAVNPADAIVAIKAAVSLGFAAAEVAALKRPDGRPPELTQTVIGLTGPSGVLPHAFSELVQTTLRDRNPGFRDFLDLFNDRFAGLLYEAWAKYRLPIEAERRGLGGALTPIDDALHALAGIGQPALRGRLPVSDETPVRFAGLLGPETRSAAAVEQTLSAVLGHAVRLVQFLGERMAIALEDRTKLPDAAEPEGRHARLGVDAVVGFEVLDVQGVVRLDLALPAYDDFARFLPGGAGALALDGMARFALGPDLGFRVRLSLAAGAVPPLRLDAGARPAEAMRLGWNTWIGTAGRRLEPGIVEFGMLDLADTAGMVR